jgi:hypothetical protein
MSWKNILKAKKKVEKDLNPYNQIKAPFQKWIQETRGITHEQMGLAPNKSRNLLRYLNAHGKASRKGTTTKVTYGANQPIAKIYQIVNKGELKKADSVTILKYITFFEKMEDSQNSNPANMKYTHPASTKKGAGGKRVKSRDKVERYGHLYNSHYRKIQEELGNKTLPAIPEDWASPNRNEAKPPMWQALFSGGERGKSSKNLVTKGLLTILEEYEAHLKKEKLL